MEEKDIQNLTAAELLALAKKTPDTDTETFKQIIEQWGVLNKEDPNAFDDFGDEAKEFASRVMSIPKFKNAETRKEIAAGIEGGFEIFNTFSNLAAANRQVKDAKEAGDALITPELPNVKGKNQELVDATEGARRDRTRRIAEIDPILQRNLDMMRSGLGNARTASGGQSGIYGAMGQNVINQTRRANNAVIPQIAAIRREQDTRYDKLVGAGINEDAMRDRQMMERYGYQYDNYLKEAEAIGGLGAVGQENRRQSMEGMGGAISSALQPISSAVLNNMRFGNKSNNFDKNFKQDFGGSTTSELDAAMNMGAVGGNVHPNYTSLGNINPKYDSQLWNIENSLANKIGY